MTSGVSSAHELPCASPPTSPLRFAETFRRLSEFTQAQALVRGVRIGARPAAGRAIVEAEAVRVESAAGDPVAAPRQVAVDVEPPEEAVAVVIPGGPLVEVDPTAAEPAGRPVVAQLQPVAHPPEVCSSQETEIVGLEPGRPRVEV